MVNAYFTDSLRRCKDNKAFTTYSISKRDIYDYQFNGKGEEPIEFDKSTNTANTKSMSFRLGAEILEESFGSGDNGSGDFEDETEEFENYPSFWKDSQNYLVFTKERKQNHLSVPE